MGMQRVFKFMAVLLPLAAFAWVTLHVRGMMDEGQGLQALAWMLGALVILALVEGVLFKCWILPPLAHRLGEQLYAGGSYAPAQDRLLVLAEQIRAGKDRSLLGELEAAVQAESRRARSWQELAHVQHEVFGDAAAALASLRRGVEQVRDCEDRAMLLCRAAYLAANSLGDAAQAQELYQEAARRYPRTAYGKFARARVAAVAR